MTDADVVVDEMDPEQEGDPSALIAKLKKELHQCRAEKQEYMDGWQRAKADYVNALKRFEADLVSAEARGALRSVESLLPVVDALERAKDHGELPDGFNAIARKLESAFSGLGLVEIGEVGEQFDPAVHDALGQDAVADKEKDHTVTAVLERGWRLGERLVRPAKVRVGQFQS